MTTDNAESVQTTESETAPEQTEIASVLTAGIDDGSNGKAEEVKSVLTSEPEPEETKPVVPEKYELNVPEGAPFEQAQVDEIAAYAKKQGLSNEQAQALVDRDVARVQSAHQEHVKLVQEHYARTLAEARADPEIGGDRWGETVQKAQRFLDKIGDKDLKQMLHDNPDISNSKAVLKALRRGYELFMAEDSLVTGDNSPAPRKLRPHEYIYGPDKED